MQWIDTTPKYGDIIRTKRQFYYHYGIFVSENEVIQFGLADDVNRPAEDIFVLKSDIYDFMGYSNIEVAKPDHKERKKMRNIDDIVSTARARIGEGGYNLFENNCEHFVNECVFSEHCSIFLDDVRNRLRKKLNKG